jgi:hypothetical protein
MSRYSLNPIKDGYKIDIGYDPPVDSYFLQVRIPNGRGETRLAQWHGNGVPRLQPHGVVSIPEIILEEAAKYASVPAGLLEMLLADRDPERELVASEPVVYAGLPNQEVWRHRSRVDPPSGAPMEIRDSRVFSRSQRIAMALLLDFIGHKPRARRLARDFAVMVVDPLLNKRSWLLNERDIQEGIREVETRLGLHWLAATKCYAGEGVPLTPELQLRRASRINKRTATSPKKNTEQPATV